MIRIDISNQQILSLASHSMAYQMGLTYFHSGRVEDVRYNPDTQEIHAHVVGNRVYQVRIELNRFGAIRDYECTCPAYSRYYGACKHVIAVLKSIQDKVAIPAASAAAVSKKSEAAEELLAFFENHAPDPYQDLLQLELNLHISMKYHIRSELSLRLGLQRLYIVKDLGEFLKCLRKGESLEFGKQFTFEPYRQTFRPEDRPIIDLLLEMYDQYQAWSLTESPYSVSSFPKKSLPLNGYYLKKFLDAAGDKTISLSLENYRPRVVRIKREGLPLQFSIQPSEHDLLLTLETKHYPIELQGPYFIYQNEIYQATVHQKEILPPILNAFRKESSHSLLLPKERREFFVSEALPALQKAGRVEIDAELASRFTQEDLLTKIYFERGERNGIVARVEFHYGEIVINPFAPNETRQREASTEDFILIRNSEAERKVLSILERAEFNVNQGKIYLQDDQAIFEFAKTYLPQLQECAELYYSEDFKFNIRSSVSFSGRIRLDENLDLLEVSFKYPDINEEELSSIFHALHLKKKYYRLRDGSFLDLNQPELESIAHLIANLNLKAEDLSKDRIALPKFRALYLENYLRQANLPGIQRNQAFKHLVQSILEPQDTEYILPPKLTNVLRDYQKTGFKWLKTLASYGLGGILADDMGLGKTLQVLAFILSEKEEASVKEASVNSAKHLALNQAPSVNYKTMNLNEHPATNANSRPKVNPNLNTNPNPNGNPSANANTNPTNPHLKPALVVAPTSLVYNWKEEAEKFTPELRVLVVDGAPAIRQALLAEIEDWDLVITSYPLLRRDTEIYSELEFSYCFLDEAQHIKNPHTINAKSVQQIRAKGYFALTGTPIENSLSELWSIFNFIMPGYLLSHTDFRKKYELPILKGDAPAVLTELSRHVSPFILRRLKKDVLLELPEKIESRMTAQMTEEQTKLYLAFLQEAKKNIAREIQAIGFERSHIKILAALTRLRQICSHPAMFLDEYDGESGKMQLFQEILSDALASGHRILVFSQFTSMLEILQNYLQNQKIEHFYLSGATPSAERIHMVQSFNAGKGDVFLISLKAGGTGLNLTGADMVIHFDPWWNPAVEDQATDRAHRIGQKNSVQVIKLITQGTIEEKVYALQEKKKELIQSVIQPGKTFLSKLTEEELKELFELD